MNPSTHSRLTNRRLCGSALSRPLLVAVGFVVLMMVGSSDFGIQAANGQTSREYKVKVAYLYNFSRYMTWPQTAFDKADAPFVIGVMGADPMGGTLDALAARKRAHGRAVSIKRFATPAELTPCHILFVSLSNSPDTHAEIIQKTAGTPVLLVGEVDGFARQGAGAAFFIDNNGTIGFKINIDSLTKKQIMVDAKLLRLAEVVKEEAPANRTGLISRGRLRK